MFRVSYVSDYPLVVLCFTLVLVTRALCLFLLCLRNLLSSCLIGENVGPGWGGIAGTVNKINKKNNKSLYLSVNVFSAEH